MIIFPNCKINLGLHVIRKRNDGFHDIETVFYPIAIYDALEIIKRPEQKNKYGESPKANLVSPGLDIPGNSENNTCVKAYELLRRDFPVLSPVEMYLHKTIPVGGGLGGGSADGAFTLKLLDQLFGLELPTEKLLDYSLRIGSDCPFFIINKPCFATGRGESLEPINLDLSAYRFVIVNPGIHVGTTEAFVNLSARVAETGHALSLQRRPNRSAKQIIQQPVETWKEDLKNDFEETVFLKYPEIKNIKEELYKAGAIYASMSGSGSTVYGIFENEKDLQFSFPPGYFVKQLTGKH